MAELTELAQWESGIYQLEEDDLVKGGADGIDNLQAKQLANRTAYLKQQAESLGTSKQPLAPLLTALATLVTSADKALYFNGANSPALTTLTAFARSLLAVADSAAARTAIGAASPADITAAVANLVGASPAALDTVYELAAALGNDANFAATVMTALSEKQQKAANLTAIAALASAANKMAYATGAGTWALADLTAFARTLLAANNGAEAVTALGLSNVGVPVGTTIYVPATTAPPGTIKKNGALLLRTAYARLWKFAEDSENMAASDDVWKPGQFSPGDGATTFRIPDGRADFVRGLDDGRGVDTGRIIGSFQADEIKSHTHSGARTSVRITASAGVNGYYAESGDTGATGGIETRPRNVAELACIKY